MLFALLAAAAGAAHAQLWRGPAALEVRAEGQGGKGAAGAEVRLLYLALEPPDGPAPVVLDSRGRVVVGGLAEGTWRLEVAREGYMSYRAEVEVREGDKPRVLAAGQHNVPGAVHTMSVRLARARGGTVPPAEPAIAAAPSAPPPAPPREREAEEATPVAPPPAGPQPAPPPVAPSTHPAPPPPAATPPSPPTQPSSPAPRPATPPAPAPSSAGEAPRPAAPAPAAAPRVLRRSYQDGTCADCRPSEAALSVEVVAAPAVAGSAGCEAALRQALAQARSGPAAGRAAGLPPSCPLVEARLPAGNRYTGYRFEASDESGEADCLAGRECPIGQSVWPADPALWRAADGTVITAAFENRSAARARRAVLTVYYTVGGAGPKR